MSVTILRKVSVSGGTVLRAANNLGDVASAATTRTNLGVQSTSEVAATIALRQSAPRGGIISAGTSPVGTTQDNAGLAFGTGDFSIGAWVRLPDWTPSGEKFLLRKSTGAGALGVSLTVNTDGTLKAYLGNGVGNTAYTSTAATGIADGAWAFLSWTFDRDGNLVFGVNGSQLGTAVSIAAQSAQSLTSATAILYWLSDGTTHTAGTLGETFIVNGLATATQIADIYKAGSIAPFAASFTFFQWADFSQGYGPIIKDRSGQNQPVAMGASGLSHAVPRNPPGIPQRAPRAALVFDGSTNTTVRATLGTQNPATGDLTLWWDGVFSSRTTNHGMAILTSAADSSPAGAVAVGLSSTALDFFMRGATTSDYTRLRLLGWQALAAGKRGVVALTRSGTTVKIFVGLDGDFVEVTNLTTTDSGGAGAVWSASIPGTYFGVGYSAGGEVFDSLTYDARLANVALTETQLRTEYERGEPGPEWVRATKTQLITGDNSTFASDTGYWTKTGATIAGGECSFAATNNNILRSSLLTIGQKYRLTLNKVSGTSVNVTNASSTSYGILTSAGANTLEFTAAGTTGLQIVSVSGASVIDDVTVEAIGYTARLRTDTAAGLTALNAAKSSTNDSTDFLLSTTGVTVSPNHRRQIIRPGTLTFTSPGTLNLQLFGASVVDTSKKWRIVSFSGTANGAANLSLGSASAGAQYFSAQAVTAADFDISTFVSRRISGANVWLASSATVTISDPVLILEQID